MSKLLQVVVVVVQIVLGLTVFIALMSVIVNVRRWRSAPYFLLREAAARNARLWALVLMGSGVALVVLMSSGSPADVAAALQRPAPTPRSTPTQSHTLIPSATLSPASTTPDPGVTATRPSASAIPPATPDTPGAPDALAPSRVPSATPSPPIATRDSTVTPQGDTRLTITAVSSGIAADFSPTDPGDTFEAGIPLFYIFFDFENMNEGVSWSGVVLVDGVVFEEASFDQLWTLDTEGVNWWRSFEWNGGWPAGQYEVRFYVGDQLADSITFRLVGSGG